MKKEINIPLEYKCSRCHKDLRDDAPYEQKCICDKTHPINYNMSGYGIWLVEIQYLGYNREFTHLIDF